MSQYYVASVILLLNLVISSGERSGRSISKQFDSMSDNNGDLNNDGPNEDTNVIVDKLCGVSGHFWNDSAVPIRERNLIGRAIYQTPSKVLETLSFIKLGKTYNLGHIYSNKSPQFLARVFNTIRQPVGYIDTTLTVDDETTNVVIGYEEQSVYATAIGNTLTQFDGLGHVFIPDPFNTGNIQNPSNHYYYNGIKGSDFTVNSNREGLEYIGIEKLPPFFTKAILLDVPGYLNIDKIDHDITQNEFIETLRYEGLSVDDIHSGDVIIINTGWITSIMIETGKKYDEIDPNEWMTKAFGMEFDVAINILIPKGVMIIGSDTGVDAISGGLTYHYYWIVCQGGFIHELLNLKQWVMDSRKGNVPYIGTYSFNPVPIKGCPGSIGHPVIYL